ncbi:hypothetical protein EXS62_01395 [Candidatus Kaiserbacteria bacterium]|nr:hypothetical protein [Candidatus Kaiserbacteria bacterium]
MHQLTRKVLDPDTLGTDGRPSVVIRAYEIRELWSGEGAAHDRLIIKYGRDATGALFGRAYVTGSSKDIKGQCQQWTIADLKQGNYQNLPGFKKFAKRLGLPAASAIGRFILDKTQCIPDVPPPPQPRRRKAKVSQDAHGQG